MAGSRDDLEIVIGADLSGLASDLKRGVQMSRDFARDVDRVAPRKNDLTLTVDVRGIRRATAEAKEVGTSFRGAAASLVGFGAKVALTGGTLVALEAGLVGVGSALQHVKESVVMAADFEQTSIAFETMLGSAERAAGVLADLRRFAAETPFGSKEVIDSARQLTAFGVAADDLIPTLKTLGTISAGGGTPLKDEIYRWGTVKVAGRAMQQDLNQYTNAGHDVYPGVAKALKIDLSEVRKYTEEGRVDINTLNTSLEQLANVKYAGLLERQANSLKGAWEQMGDAFDRAKLKLGQVVVRELGLKQATKDAEGFANRLERFVGGPFVTGSIRLLGEFGHAVAHVGGQLGKAAADGADVFGTMAAQLPEFQGTLGKINEIVQGLREFRIDPRAVSEFAIEASKDLLRVGGGLVLTIGETGAVFKKEVIDPILEAIREMKSLAEIYRQGKRVATFSATDLGIAASGYLDKLTPEGRVREQLKAAAPELAKGGADAADSGLQRFARSLEKMSERIDGIGESMRRRKAEEDDEAVTRSLYARLAEIRKETLLFENFERGRVGQLHALIPGNPLAGLSGGMLGFREQFKVLNAGFGAGSVLKGVMDASTQLSLPGSTGLTARQMELARKVKDDFNPLDKLNRDLAELEATFKAGGLDKAEFEFARNREVRGVADSLGLNHPVRLPDTVLAGSEADARLLAQATSGGQQQKTTEDLLRQIAEHLLAIRTTNKAMEQAPMPRPVNVSLPGKG